MRYHYFENNLYNGDLSIYNGKVASTFHSYSPSILHLRVQVIIFVRFFQFHNESIIYNTVWIQLEVKTLKKYRIQRFYDFIIIIIITSVIRFIPEQLIF